MPKGVYARKPRAAFLVCSVADCSKPMRAKGLCFDHYRRNRTYGRLEKLATHGATAGGKRPTEWRIWSGMIERCTSPTCPAWKNYGGRGIRVFVEWLNDFAAFLSYMGPRPRGMSIDRIDNDGHYEPGNVRWATSKEQNSNRRDNILLTFGGETLTCCEWARRLGVNFTTLRRRHKKGWSHERILTTPFRYSGPRVAKHKTEGVSNARR